MHPKIDKMTSMLGKLSEQADQTIKSNSVFKVEDDL